MKQPLRIAPASWKELPLLEQYLGKKSIPWYHTSKLERQDKKESVWLIAWQDGVPLGHLQVRWNGAKDAILQKHIHQYAHITSFGVMEEYRNQGIGTQLLEEAERIAKEKAFHQIGMAVGIENVRARSLYDRFGYKDWGKGTFTTSWDYLDKQGKTARESEECFYLLKPL